MVEAREKADEQGSEVSRKYLDTTYSTGYSRRVSVPREFREQKLLTIAEVASLMGVHRATVWKWIKGDCLRATVPTRPDPADPERQVPVSTKYRGVRPEDLAKWKSVYRPASVSRTSPASSGKSKSKRAAKRAKPRR